MLRASGTISRLIVGDEGASFEQVERVGMAAFMLGLTSFSAHAQQERQLGLRSVLPSNWCVDVPGAAYEPGKPLLISNCTGAPNQTFSSGDGSNLTVGGLCLDGLAQAPGQPPGEGDTVVITDCDGSE